MLTGTWRVSPGGSAADAAGGGRRGCSLRWGPVAWRADGSHRGGGPPVACGAAPGCRCVLITCCDDVCGPPAVPAAVVAAVAGLCSPPPYPIRANPGPALDTDGDRPVRRPGGRDTSICTDVSLAWSAARGRRLAV